MKTIISVICAALLAGPALADDHTKTGTGPVKVFVLIGQSNMNGRGNIATLKDKLIKDLPQQYPPKLMELRKDVWIWGANGDGISGQKDNKCLEPGFGQWKYYGPELGFGHKMGDKFKEQVLLIKVIGGGTSLGKDWVSPVMSKRTGRPVGGMYIKMLRMVTEAFGGLEELYRDYKPEMGYQICGVFWCQGNADGGKFAAEYADNLVDLISGVRANFGIADLPFIAAESLSSRTPGEQFVKGVAMVNAQQKNTQAAAIHSRAKINLKGEDYLPYNSAGDTTHWRHNSRAFLDVGNWAAELMIPMLKAEAVNHAKDPKVQKALKDILPLIPVEPAAPVK